MRSAGQAAGVKASAPTPEARSAGDGGRACDQRGRLRALSERAFGSLKYEHFYRHEIDDGHQLGLEVEAYRQLFNTVRPHRTLDGRRPLSG